MESPTRSGNGPNSNNGSLTLIEVVGIVQRLGPKERVPSASVKDASSLLRPPWFYLSQAISHSERASYLHSEKDFLRFEKAFYNAVKACNVVNLGLAISVKDCVRICKDFDNVFPHGEERPFILARVFVEGREFLEGQVDENSVEVNDPGNLYSPHI